MQNKTYTTSGFAGVTAIRGLFLFTIDIPLFDENHESPRSVDLKTSEEPVVCFTAYRTFGLSGLNSISLNLPIKFDPLLFCAIDHVCPPSGLIIILSSVAAKRLSVYVG